MTPEHALRIVLALERIATALEPTLGAPACGHPPEFRSDYSTMGRARWICEVGRGGCGVSVGMEDM